MRKFVAQFQSSSGEAAALRDSIGELRRLWLDAALQEAEEAPTDLRNPTVTGNAESKKAAPEGGVQFAVRQGMTEQERYEELKDRYVYAPEYEKGTKYQKDVNDLTLIPRAKGLAEKIIFPLVEELGILNRSMKTPDVDVNFIFSKNGGLSESTFRQLRTGGNYADFAKALINLDKILENAVLVEQHGDKNKGTVREDPTLENVSVLIGAIRDGNYIIPVQFEIKKSSAYGGRLYMTVALTKIRADVLGRTNKIESRDSSLISATKYSIADIFQEIKPEDLHFLKYVPDGFLNNEQKAAKLKAIEEDRQKIAKLAEKESPAQRSARGEADTTQFKMRDGVEQTERLEKVNSVEGAQFSQRRTDEATDREILMLAEAYGEGQTELSQFRDAMTRYQDYDEAAQEHLEKMQNLLKERKEVFDSKMPAAEKQARLDALDAQIRQERSEADKAEQNAARALDRVTQLEKGRALQDILQRERAAQRQRTRAQVNESARRRDTRRKVEKLAAELQRRVLKPSEKRYIPADLMRQTVDVLKAINFDSGKPGTKSGETLRARLLELQERYRQLEKDTTYEGATYDPIVAEMLQNMVQAVGSTPVNKMTAAQLESVYDTLRAMTHVIQTSVKVKLGEEERTAWEIAHDMTRETNSVNKPKSL